MGGATAPTTASWEPVGGGMVLQQGDRTTTLRQAPSTAFPHARNVADAAAQTAAASASSGVEDFPCGFRSTGGLLGGWPRGWSTFMASASQRATTAAAAVTSTPVPESTQAPPSQSAASGMRRPATTALVPSTPSRNTLR